MNSRTGRAAHRKTVPYSASVPLRRDLSNLRTRLKESLSAAQSRALARAEHAPLAGPREDPPVVARLMVEIRSDGSRTVARGALEDMATGEKVALEAKGDTPAQLVGSLAKTLLTMPLIAGSAVRKMLDDARRRSDSDGER